METTVKKTAEVKNEDIQNFLIAEIREEAARQGVRPSPLAKIAGLPTNSPEVLNITKGLYTGTKSMRMLEKLMTALGMEWKVIVKFKKK